MKIKSKDTKVASIKLIVPIDGVIEVDADGIADVSPKCAVQLVQNTNDWEYLTKKKEEPKSESEEETTEEESEEETTEEDDEKQEFLSRIEKMKLSEMKEFAKEAGRPEEEYTSITSKKLMIAYLLKNFDE